MGISSLRRTTSGADNGAVASTLGSDADAVGDSTFRNANLVPTDMQERSGCCPAARDILRLAETMRQDIGAVDAAGAGICAAMRNSTMDPDGAHALLQALHDQLEVKLDALVAAALGAAQSEDQATLRCVAATSSRNFTR